VVGIGLGQILLQESQVLVGALPTLGRLPLGRGRGCSQSRLDGVEFGELGSEIGG
jgi:hypothetical protein